MLPNNSQGWVFGILPLFLSYFWTMSTSAVITRFILDIAKTFLSLWILLNGCYDLGKFLQNQSESVWRKLYEAQNNQGLITLTGFDCASFASLCEIFAQTFDSYTPFVPSVTSCFERVRFVLKLHTSI
jgi:hypothetical protein